ncbi:MAG: M56 family metallopeptidase, partial [Planctomycetales bacterium]|nr:M56 family metallopeptidase [Planctomycetales bacterium]
PVFSLALPAWSVLPKSKLTWIVRTDVAVDRAQHVDADFREDTARGPVPKHVPIGAAHTPDTLPARQTLDAEVATAGHGEPTAQHPDPLRTLATLWPAVLLGVWLAGVLAVLGRWLAGALSLAWLRRRSQVVTAGPVFDEFARLAARMGMRRRVLLLVSGERQMPMQWGLRRVYVLLPGAAHTWPMQRLDAVLLHELAHVCRRDCLAMAIGSLVSAVYWYHPLVWWAVRRMRDESERACDDEAISAGCGAVDYAEQLLHVVAQSRGTTLPIPATAMAKNAQLEDRVRSILAPLANRGRASLRGAVATCLVFTLATAGLAALRPTHSPGDATEVGQATNTSVEAAPPDAAPNRIVIVGHVDDTAEGRLSIAGSGHAVSFERPAGSDRLVAVEIFASRYGHEAPPAEDFHVYLLDADRHLLHAQPIPYSIIERGTARWYSLPLPAVAVPAHFIVALAFNPHRTKGVYLGIDEGVGESHSLVGRPTIGFEPFEEQGDWMVRAVLADDGPLDNPFE